MSIRSIDVEAKTAYISVNRKGFEMIKVKYSSIDGCRIAKSFKSLKGARAFAQKMVGKNPEMGSSYAVSSDGIGKVQAYGSAGGKLVIDSQDIVLADLFGDEVKA